MFRRRSRPLATLAATVLLAAAGLAAQAGAAAPAQALAVIGSGTSLTLSGTSGDFVTKGATYRYTVPSALFDAKVSGGGNRVQVAVTQGNLNEHWWNLDLRAPAGQRLTAGTTYTPADSPTPSTSAGLEFGGEGRGCGTTGATFTVTAADFTADGLVRSFAATFAASCTTGPAGQRFSGRVVLVGREFVPPRPSPDPARSTAFRISGPFQEPVTKGGNYVLTPSNAGFRSSATADGRHVHVEVSRTNDPEWRIDLDAPAGQRLTPGRTYKATFFPSQPAAGAGFSVAPYWGPCSDLTAYFTVWQASFAADGAIRAFDATFLQFCQSGSTYATGEISVIAPGAAPPAPAATSRPAATARPGSASPVASPVTSLLTSSGVPAPGTASTGTATTAGGAAPAEGDVDVLGLAAVTGTLACRGTGPVTVTGTVSQQRSVLRAARAAFSTTASCTGSSARWRAAVTSTSGTPFTAGSAYVTGPASGPVLLT